MSKFLNYNYSFVFFCFHSWTCTQTTTTTNPLKSAFCVGFAVEGNTVECRFKTKSAALWSTARKEKIANNIHHVSSCTLPPARYSSSIVLYFQAARTCWCPDYKGSAGRTLLPMSRVKIIFKVLFTYIYTHFHFVKKITTLFNKLNVTKRRYIVSR